jgi:low temperature requirement protein LtrA
MTPDKIFAIANNGILIFWLLLIVAPGWRGTRILVQSVAIPVVLGLTYIALFASAAVGGLPAGASFSSLHGVTAFFSSPLALTAGWVHYLVFDLFVGAWETRDAQRRGISHFLVIPCLVVTLLVGPVGLLLYLGLRAVLGKGGFFLSETPA